MNGCRIKGTRVNIYECRPWPSLFLTSTLGSSMTWYAHNLYMPATDRALSVLRLRQDLAPFLFVVDSLEGIRWHTPIVQHGLGPVGLAVVRPIGPADDYLSEWYGKPILPWESLKPVPPGPGLLTNVEEEQAPPASLLQYIKELSAEAEAPALYYSSFMWGGDVEFEASWVFTPTQHTYITQSSLGEEPEVRSVTEHGVEVVAPGDALRKGLAHFDIQLPTGFFALHTRAFPWERYRVA